MKFWLSILAALLLSGCSILRHDATVAGIFPPPEAYESGVAVEGDWAK